MKKNKILILATIGILGLSLVGNNRDNKVKANSLNYHDKLSLISPQNIINNQRFQINDTTQEIYQSIVNIPFKGLVPEATGFVVGRNKVLTCAHVSESTDLGAKITPALNGEERPFGSFEIEKIDIPEGFYPPEGGVKFEYDYSVLTIAPNEKGEYIGDVVGQLELRPITVDDLWTGMPIRVIGYPGDHRFQMWESPGKLLRSDGYYGDEIRKLLGQHFLEYDADGVWGNSGSPVLDADNKVIGFDNYDSDNGEGFGNGATMLEPKAMKWISSKL